MNMIDVFDSVLRYFGLVRLSVHIDETTACAQAHSKSLNKLYYQREALTVMRKAEDEYALRIAEYEAMVDKIRFVLRSSGVTVSSGFVEDKE